MDFSQLDQKIGKIQFEKILMLKALIGETQIVQLQKRNYL